MKKLLIAIAIALVAFGFATAFAESAEAAPLKAATVTATKTVKAKRPQAERVVRGRDGNLYALYQYNGHRAAAFTGLKRHAKSVTIPRYVKFKGERFEVTAIHEVGLTERTDIKRVRILAKNLETVEEPALYKSWRAAYGKKLNVSIKYRVNREWLNADYEWR